MPQECMKIIESKSKVRQSRAKAVVAKTRRTNPRLQFHLLLLLQLKQLSPIVLPAVEYAKPGSKYAEPMPKYSKPVSKSANSNGHLTDMVTKLVSSNAASSSGGVAYQGPIIPTPSKQGTKVTKDQVQIPSSQSTAPVQPPVSQSETPTPIYEPVVAPVSTPMPNMKSSIPYPSRRDNERRHDQANEQIEKFYEIFKDMSFKISFTDALILMPKFASTLKALIGNKEKLSEMARTSMNEHCSAVILNKLPRKLRDPGKFLIPCESPGMDECLALADVTASGNPTPHDDLIVSTTSPTLTLFGDSDFLLFEEADSFLGLEDDPDSPKINPFYYDPEGDILLLEAILNSLSLAFGDPLYLHHNDTGGSPIVTVKLTAGAIYAKSTYELWNDLKESYDKVYGFAIFNLHTNINSLTQSGSSLAEYYNKLNSLWKQFDAMFLMGLYNNYLAIRSNILTREPLPLVKAAFAIVSGEESHRNITSNRANKPVATVFAAKFVDKKKANNNNNYNKWSNFNSRGPNSNLKCTNCNKIRDTVDRCLEIVGYPTGYVKKNFIPNSRHVTSNNNTIDPQSNNANSNAASKSLVSISNEQLTRLINLLNNNGVSSANANMSGANQHMTVFAKFLINVVNISNLGLTVGHSNRTQSLISKIRD
nr:hypothetical protein [Tanacetum cinerariifolium]